MAHWGWYWKVKKKHVARKLCSSLISIDSFKFYKNNTMGGFSVQPLEVNAEPTSNHLKITYRKRKEYSYLIPIEKQPCNYGGYRSFFKCPLCQKRMRFLYFAEQSLFLCRKCLNLSYESQRLRPTMRYYYMTQKIKDSMKDKDGNLSLYEKPFGMHKDKYEKLKSKQFYYEAKSKQAITRELRKWFGAKAEPYLDDFFDYVDESKKWRKKNN